MDGRRGSEVAHGTSYRVTGAMCMVLPRGRCRVVQCLALLPRRQLVLGSYLTFSILIVTLERCSCEACMPRHRLPTSLPATVAPVGTAPTSAQVVQLAFAIWNVPLLAAQRGVTCLRFPANMPFT